MLCLGRLLVFLSALALLVGVGACVDNSCFEASDCERGTFCTNSLTSPGECASECSSNFDCGEGAGTTVRCTDDGRCVPIETLPPPPPPPPLPPPLVIDGYDDAPGTGTAFVFNRIAVSPPGGPPHALEPLADLINDQMRQSVLGGRSLVLLEIAGADNLREDASVTVKLYAGLDADDPSFPANNFRTPAGYDSCCEFKIASQSLTPLGQARWRVPARIERGRLRTLVPTPFPVPLWPGDPDSELESANLAAVIVAARVGPEGLSEGFMSGAWPMSDLFTLDNPFCRVFSPACPVEGSDTLLRLVGSLGLTVADVDLDDDGLECVADGNNDGLLDLCCDGSIGGTGCMSRNGTCQSGVDRVPAVDPNVPASCALDPRFADGLSIIFEFDAVPATITGVGP